MSSPTITVSTLSPSARAFGGESEIEPVAGVVLDDQQRALVAGHREQCREHRIRAGRREHVAAHRGGQHALADEAGMGGLVAGAAAGNDGDARLVPVGAQDHADVGIAVEPRQAAVGGEQLARDRIRDQGATRVQQMAHGRHFPWSFVRRASRQASRLVRGASVVWFIWYTDNKRVKRPEMLRRTSMAPRLDKSRSGLSGTMKTMLRSH
jgi:hypothetical protein